MLRKAIITLATFFFAGVVVFGAVAAASPAVGLPRPIEPHSPCPVVGCASGSCHGFGDVPEPGCASVECHAWDTLATRYHRASDASLNLWILAPVVLVGLLVLIVRKL